MGHVLNSASILELALTELGKRIPGRLSEDSGLRTFSVLYGHKYGSGFVRARFRLQETMILLRGRRNLCPPDEILTNVSRSVRETLYSAVSRHLELKTGDVAMLRSHLHR